MTRYAVAVGTNGSRSLVDLEELSPLESADGLQAVMMARPDVNVQVIELPAVPPREVDGFLAYRTRSLYPGQPEETAYDYRELKWGGKRYAVLFLVSSRVLEEYRRVAGGRPLLLPYSLLGPLLRRARPARVTVGLLWLSAWIEVIVLAPGEPPRSHVLPRTGDDAADGEQVLALLPAAPPAFDGRVLCAAKDVAALRGALAACAGTRGSFAVTSMEQSLRRLGRQPSSLFVRHARRVVVPRKVRVAVALLILAALSLLLLKRSVDRDAAYAALLNRTVLELQARSEGQRALQKEVDGLQAEMKALGVARPVDPGQVLAELVVVLGPGTRLESFSLDNDFFQLEAVGNNPLQLMERFKSRETFTEVRLLQIVPRKDSGQELFRVTGRVR